jgi:antitoxin (DNA-binding transcriptional repressor) of toxin-antitoxin stability system
MTTITLDKAKDDLPALVERALAGEEIVIETANKRVRLAPEVVPVVFPEPAASGFDEETAKRRGYGSMKGQFDVPDTFFDPLPEDELKLWEGQSST